MGLLDDMNVCLVFIVYFIKEVMVVLVKDLEKVWGVKGLKVILYVFDLVISDFKFIVNKIKL